MRAIRPTKTGGPEVLVLTEVPMPVAGPDDVLVRVEAAGVNPIDVVQRSGSDKVPLPLLIGVEGAGKIEALGANVTGLEVGQRVAWLTTPGSYATHLVVKAAEAVPVPDGVDAKTAASAMVQGVIGHFLARDTFRLERGSTCLIFAALMGVGPVLSQIAKRSGAEVIAVVSDSTGIASAKAHGAKYAFLAGAANLGEVVADVTNGRGVDVVYDQIGVKTVQLSMALVKTRGTVVFFGHFGGPGPRFDVRQLGAAGSIFVTRPKLKDYIATREELLARTGDVFAWLKDGTLKIPVESAFPLGAAKLAHQRFESKGSGKVLILP